MEIRAMVRLQESTESLQLVVGAQVLKMHGQHDGSAGARGAPSLGSWFCGKGGMHHL